MRALLLVLMMTGCAAEAPRLDFLCRVVHLPDGHPMGPVQIQCADEQSWREFFEKQQSGVQSGVWH